MNAELKRKVWEYLNSFDDMEPLDVYEMTDLFAKANRLLSDILRDDNYPDEFPILTIDMSEIEFRCYKTDNVDRDTLAKIASKMGSDYLESGQYAVDFDNAAREFGLVKLRGSIAQHLDDILVDDETEDGGVSHHGETLREFLEEIGEDKLKKKGIDYLDDVSVLDDILEECGIMPIE